MGGVLRIVGSTAVLVTVYYLLPLSHSSLASAVTILVVGVVVFIGLGFRMRATEGWPRLQCRAPQLTLRRDARAVVRRG